MYSLRLRLPHCSYATRARTFYATLCSRACALDGCTTFPLPRFLCWWRYLPATYPNLHPTAYSCYLVGWINMVVGSALRFTAVLAAATAAGCPTRTHTHLYSACAKVVENTYYYDCSC